jgi:acetyl esterase/lipase
MFLALACPSLYGQDLDPVTRWATLAPSTFRIFPDHEKTLLAGPGIVYRRAGNIDLSLNVITTGPETEVRPTLIYIHGGGWVHLAREDRILYLLTYLAQGMNTVNIDYRVANQSPAPAAVEDCRCALHWVFRHAKEYGFDTNKIVVAGESAGGHLALMTGMLDPSAGFDNSCAWSNGEEPVKVAAIVNFFGITDVPDVLEGPHRQSWAVEWLGSLPNRMELARKLSPLTYVRAGLPPIITIHGTKDPAVPYQHAVRLHQGLESAGVPNQLVTIPEGGHSGFPASENLRAQEAIFKFLRDHGVLAGAPKDRP